MDTLAPPVRRPLLRYHGGKWRLAPWIIGHFPPHRVYTEAFGGAGSVLLRKARSYGEIYNDLSDEVVSLFRVLRSDRAAELIEAVRLTPFARAEFVGAYEPASDAVERSRRLIIRSFMGFGSDGHHARQRTGFRANAHRNGTTPSHDWANYPQALRLTVERLRGVVIECRPAAEVLRHHDGPDTLHYCDPPYLPETRSQKSRRGGLQYHCYPHEMTRDEHAELLELLDDLVGAVVLSGYPSPQYTDRLKHWQVVECEALADGARRRTECLWLNEAAAAGLRQMEIKL